MLLIITFNIITYVILHLKLILFSIHNTGLFEMIVGVLTTCHIKYTRVISQLTILKTLFYYSPYILNVINYNF